MMLYFAYGSNMDWNRMSSRCASVQFLFKAALPEYALAFTRFSRTNQCGTADIIPAPGETVWGVVYDIDAQDRPVLDKHEGVAIRAYRPENITVLAEGDGSRAVKVFTYVVCERQTPQPKPSPAYLQFLLTGASRWGLPEPYVQRLHSVETIPVP